MPQLARRAAGGELTPIILDVTDIGQIADAAAAISGHTGHAGLDGLVNNAGFGLACLAELVQLVIINSIGVRFSPPFAGPLDGPRPVRADVQQDAGGHAAPRGERQPARRRVFGVPAPARSHRADGPDGLAQPDIRLTEARPA